MFFIKAMKKYQAVIKKITIDVIALEAENPSDLFDWKDLDAYEKLPRETLEKLRRIDRENDGYWEFAEIKPEDEIIKDSQSKRVDLSIFV
jgi:hypothetical protein